MRSPFALVVLAALALVPTAKAAPDQGPMAVTEVRGGFSKRLVAGTVAATLPKAAPVTAPRASLKVTVEIGSD